MRAIWGAWIKCRFTFSHTSSNDDDDVRMCMWIVDWWCGRGKKGLWREQKQEKGGETSGNIKQNPKFKKNHV